MEDLAAIVEFNLGLARESEARELDPQVLASGARAILADPGTGQYWIATSEGAPCGQSLVTVEPSDWGGGEYWWLQSVYVAPDYRGRGVFSALWRTITTAARESSRVCALRLYVDRGNSTARAVYEHLGMSQSEYVVYETPSLKT